MADLTDRQKESHAAARDTVKHLVTLSTASIGVLIAIFKDVLKLSEGAAPPGSLWWAFLAFGLSALFGLLALQSLTGNLEKRANPTIYEKNVSIFAAVQILAFVAALVLAGTSVVRA